jgi:hypothetical protein
MRQAIAPGLIDRLCDADAAADDDLRFFLSR